MPVGNRQPRFRTFLSVGRRRNQIAGHLRYSPLQGVDPMFGKTTSARFHCRSAHRCGQTRTRLLTRLALSESPPRRVVCGDILDHRGMFCGTSTPTHLGATMRPVWRSVDGSRR
jgi:hypothetical protein